MNFRLNATVAATVTFAALSSAAHAAESKGVMPAYPACAAKSGDAKQDCLQAANAASKGVESPVTVNKGAKGAAPKYPKALVGDTQGATTPQTRKAVQGVGPKYPQKNDANGKPMATGGAAALTAAGSKGVPGTKGVAPAFPGKPVAVEGTKPGAVSQKVKGSAPAYPKMNEPKAATTTSLKPGDTTRVKGVAPKYPKSN